MTTYSFIAWLQKFRHGIKTAVYEREIMVSGMNMGKHSTPAKHRNTPQSYLLNLYPVREKDAALVGTLEKLGNEGKHAFHSIDELLHLLGIDNFKSGGQDNDQTI